MSQLSIAAASAADVEHEKDVFAILGFTASPLYRYALARVRRSVYLRVHVFCFVLFCFVLFCFVLLFVSLFLCLLIFHHIAVIFSI